ncbi:MAG: hypothetical protein OET90_01510 [Desulfuromonadales bacterium]|nr:hypothetical protein [Desulfuromonadales bacterium]
MEIIETVIAGLVVAIISSCAGFLLNSTVFSKGEYLPNVPKPDSRGYQFFPGKWHEYHFTYDPKLEGARWLASAEINFELDKNFIVDGTGFFATEHRRVLNYLYRGQISSGSLYYTAVCKEDPDDAYCVLFRNINDDQLIGVIAGLDYEKHLFSSPILLSKEPVNTTNAGKILDAAKIKHFFGAHV